MPIVCLSDLDVVHIRCTTLPPGKCGLVGIMDILTWVEREGVNDVLFARRIDIVDVGFERCAISAPIYFTLCLRKIELLTVIVNNIEINCARIGIKILMNDSIFDSNLCLLNMRADREVRSLRYPLPVTLAHCLCLLPRLSRCRDIQ
jgi:hypothetical protein